MNLRYTTSRASAFGAVKWNAAIREMRADHVRRPVGFFTVRNQIETLARTRPLYAAGAFDRAAVMATAVAAAKAHQRAHGSTWAVAMSVALKAAWQTAKLARHVTVH